MTKTQLEQYASNPKGMDEQVRKWFKIPDNRYYTVSTYPVPGEVRIIPNMNREVKNKKISKSDN